MPGFNVGDRVFCYQRGYPNYLSEMPHFITARRMINEDGSLRPATEEDTPQQYTVLRLENEGVRTAMSQGQIIQVDYVFSEEPGDISPEWLEIYVAPPPPEE